MSVTIDKSMGKRHLKNFLPPEGVPIEFIIATLGARFGAQFLDILITYGGGILLVVLLAWADIMSGSTLFAFFVLFMFLLRIPYYIFSELVWNGRTLGKRIVKLRVISADGRRLTPYQITARNLMKEVEVFLPISFFMGAESMSAPVLIGLGLWMVGVLLVPFFNKRRQRLGDMAAATIVVEQPRAVLLQDLSETVGSDGAQFTFDPAQLAIYGRYELQTLEAILRDPPKSPEALNRVKEVAKTIQRKINYPMPIGSGGEWDFLLEFYRCQREFLESRQLFGDTRENKFHAEKSEDSEAGRNG